LGFECFSDDDIADIDVAEVGAGGGGVFSSLPPHLTGPNLTGEVRKAYILQYAPQGAEVLRGDPSGEPTERVPADDPDRQFPVLRAGVAVCPDGSGLGPWAAGRPGGMLGACQRYCASVPCPCRCSPANRSSGWIPGRVCA